MIIISRTKWLFAVFSTFLVVLLPACTLFDDAHKNDYLKSNAVVNLTIPVDLKAPVDRNPIEIPQVAADYKPSTDLTKPPQLEEDAAILARVESDSESVKAINSTPVEAQALSSKIVTDPQSISSLLVNAKFDIAWARIEKALTALGFIIVDSNLTDQTYTVYKTIDKIEIEEIPQEPNTELELEKSPQREEYQVLVADESPQSRVSVQDKEGHTSGSDLAKHLLVQIKGILENPNL